MKRALLLATLVALTAASCAEDREPAPKGTEVQAQCETIGDNGVCALYGVSLVELIARPEKFHKQRVRLTGYVHREFEGNGVYLHADDEKHSLYKNGLWIEFKSGYVSQCQNQYALIEGEFDANDHGHMGLWSGALREIDRCDPWR